MATARSGSPLALTALFAGATAIATSALFVKVSEAGPVSTAFWRVFLALPVLWVWAFIDGRQSRYTVFARNRGPLIAAGLFFAGDLAVWHWSIVLTSVANATLLANLAPVFVTLAAWLLFGKTPAARFVGGLAAALAGVGLLIGGDFTLPGRASTGNLLGVVTAMFYAGYQLVVTRLRAEVSTSGVMAWSGLVIAAVLLPVALASGEAFFPVTGWGWLKLFGLALIAQAAGQSLIAYAMAHLPATLSSVSLLLQPVMAAAFAWWLLGETLTAVQMLGAVLALAGIGMAHQAEKRP